MFSHWKLNPLIKCKGKILWELPRPLVMQIRVERSRNAVWGKVQALASRPGLVSLRCCTHRCACALGAAPPRCLCHMKPESELVSVTSCRQKPPRTHPLNQNPPSCPALTSCSPTMPWGSRVPAQLLGCAWWNQPWVMPHPSPGSGVSSAWQTPWGLSAWIPEKVQENGQRCAARSMAGLDFQTGLTESQGTRLPACLCC